MEKKFNELLYAIFSNYGVMENISYLSVFFVS
jgi:hypothetical protein